MEPNGTKQSQSAQLLQQLILCVIHSQPIHNNLVIAIILQESFFSISGIPKIVGTFNSFAHLDSSILLVSMHGNKYDTDVTTWSPEGKLHQVLTSSL